jgi:hypothetical protein
LIWVRYAKTEPDEKRARFNRIAPKQADCMLSGLNASAAGRLPQDSNVLPSFRTRCASEQSVLVEMQTGMRSASLLVGD